MDIFSWQGCMRVKLGQLWKWVCLKLVYSPKKLLSIGKMTIHPMDLKVPHFQIHPYLTVLYCFLHCFSLVPASEKWINVIQRKYWFISRMLSSINLRIPDTACWMFASTAFRKPESNQMVAGRWFQSNKMRQTPVFLHSIISPRNAWNDGLLPIHFGFQALERL